jgi:O-antigen/teichoic acid export membrane protein
VPNRHANLVSDDGLARLSRNAFHNSSALLLPAVLSLVATPFIVHRLGDERFGLYMLTLSAVGFGGLLDLGLDTAATKYVAEGYARKDLHGLSGVLNVLLTTRLFLGALMGAVGFVCASSLSTRVLAVAPRLIPDATYLVRLASVSVGISMVVGTLASLPRAAHRFDITSRITLAASLSLTLITVGLVSVGRGIREVAVAELAVTGLQLAAYWRVSRNLFPEWRFKPSLETLWLKKLAGFGGLVAMGNLTAIIFVHVNRILVGRFLGAAAVTYFTVPWSVTARLTQIIYSLAEVVTPLASSLTASASIAELVRVYRRVTKVVLLLCGTVAIPLFLAAGDLLAVWMGPEFAQRSGSVLRVLVVSTALQSLAMVAYVVLTGMGRPGAANAPALMGALVNLTAAILAGSRYGLVGMAGAVLMGVAVQTLLLEWRVGLALSSWGGSRQEIRRVLAAAIGATAIGLAVGRVVVGPWVRLTALTLVGIVSFHGLLWMLGSYSRSERDVLLRQIQSVITAAREGNGPESPGSRSA